MTASLTGKRIAFLATDGVEQIELTDPWEALDEAGATLELISLKEGHIQAMNHFEPGDEIEVHLSLDQADPADYDGLILPGGLGNPDTLRSNPEALDFVRHFFEEGKVVAAICHAAWILIDAGVVQGRTLTSWPNIKSDVINAGGHWVDEEVHCENGFISSRKPDDLEAFSKKIIEELSEVHHTVIV